MKYCYPKGINSLASIFSFLKKIEFDKENISFVTGKEHTTIRSSCLPIELDVKTNWFWHTFTLELDEASLSFRLLNRHDPQGLHTYYKKYVEQWKIKDFKRNQPPTFIAHVTAWLRYKERLKLAPIKEKYKEINSFLSCHYFIRKSEFKRFMENCPRPNFDINGLEEYFDGKEIQTILKLKRFYNDPYHSLKKANERFSQREIQRYKSILDDLHDSQKIACVTNDDTNLILAGAGTGKTKTLEVKTNYLISSGKFQSDEILLIAYGNKAKEELDDRIGKTLGVAAMTFHGFGRSIVEQHKKRKIIPDVLAEDKAKKRKFIDDEIQRLLAEDQKFIDLAIRYFDDFLFPYKNPFDFDSLGAYYEYLKANEIRCFSTDKMKSYEEVTIGNFLHKNGIEFVYEKLYDKEISEVGFTSYRPDFYLPDFDIYIEHYGMNSNFVAPEYMNPKKYSADRIKKQKIHKLNGTRCIETFSYMKQNNTLLSFLEEQLKNRGVIFNPIPKEEYLDKLKDLGAVSKLSDLCERAINLTRTMNHSVESLREVVNQSNTPSLHAAINILEPLLEHYEKHLSTNNTVDFDTMINDAIDIIQNGNFRCPYKVIMVDEYQDISSPRADIIKAIQEKYPDVIVFGVGDDWQAIYRFSGSDLRLTYNFFDEFGAGTEESLMKTFRFNDGINKVATRFILENECQKKREFEAEGVDDARIHVIKATEKEQEEKIKDIISWIGEKVESDTKDIIEGKDKHRTILLLNRYKYKKPKYFNELVTFAKSKGLGIKFQSCHASKGKEAGYVIIMDMMKGKNGFPAEKIEHPLIELLLPKLESYEHAEERRIFYVALTRAKQRVFILSIEENCSEFVNKLRGYGKKLIDETSIKASPDSLNVTDLSCPECKTGRLVKNKENTYSFCANIPLCDYRLYYCKKCGGSRKRVGEFQVCKDNQCNAKTPTCPKCSGDLKPTTGKYGKFWACYSWDCNGSKDWRIYEKDADVYKMEYEDSVLSGK